MRMERGPFGCIGILPVSGKDKIIDYQIDILENKHMENIVSVFLREYRNRTECCFDLTGLLSLNVFDQSNIHILDKRKALCSLLLTLSMIEDSFLTPENILFDEDSIYYDSHKKALCWCYFPIEREDILATEPIWSKVESLLSSPYLSNILTEKEKSHIVSLFRDEREADLKTFLHDLPESNAKTTKKQTNKPLFFRLVAGLIILYALSIVWENADHRVPAKMNEYAFLFLFFALLLYYFYTLHKEKKKAKITEDLPKEVLFPKEIQEQSNDWPPRFFIRIRDSKATVKLEKAVILNHEFIIGNDGLLCDYIVNDPSIDSIHAKIQKKSQSFYLMDLGSQSGTWLRNQRLISHRSYELREGDIVQLGELLFLFTDSRVQ